MNKVTLLSKDSINTTNEVSLGQIYSRVRHYDNQTIYYIVATDNQGFYLICLQDGSRCAMCTKVFGLQHSRTDFTLVTEPIVIEPGN